MISFLSYAFFAASLLFAYWLWVAPLLRARPEFKQLYAATDSFWAAVWIKLNTIKTRLASILLMIASGIVALHDFLIPIATGIDWTPVTAKVPAWAWPFVSFAIGALFLWLRQVTAQTQAREMAAVVAGATIEDAKVEAGILSPAGTSDETVED